MKLIKTLAIATTLLAFSPLTFAYQFTIYNYSGNKIVNQYHKYIKSNAYAIGNSEELIDGHALLYSTFSFADDRACVFYVFRDPQQNYAANARGTAVCTVTDGGTSFVFN